MPALKDVCRTEPESRNPFRMLRDAKKVAGPGQKEEMIDHFKAQRSMSIWRCCPVLGFRRQSYYCHKQGHRSEELDARITELWHQVTKRFVAWGFFFCGAQGQPWNHKQVYRIWRQEGLQPRLSPKRQKIRREFQGLSAPDKINEGWAMDFLSDWMVGHGQEKWAHQYGG